MGLTRDFKETVIARVERDPAFAKELLDEATTLLTSGEARTAWVGATERRRSAPSADC